MHITKKAIFFILTCLLIISAAYSYYQRLHTQKLVNAPILVTPQAASNISAYSWVWEYTTRKNGTRRDALNDQFVLTLNEKTKTMTSTTDCNNLSSTFVKNNEVVSFAPFTSTQKSCENTEEEAYKEELALTSSYVIVSNELYINLSNNFGTMVFRKGEKISISTSTVTN